MAKKKHIEHIHTEENDPKWNMPYVPAIKVHSGKTVYVAGVTAAPVYHSHPHIKEEFDNIPLDPAEQTAMAIENLRAVLQAAGGDLSDIVRLDRFMVDQAKNQDAVNRTMKEYFGDHLVTSTSVEIVRLATDPRLILELTAVAIIPE